MSVAMLALQGACWTSLKLEKGPLRDRAIAFGTWAGIAMIVLFLVGHLFVRFGGLGYHISVPVATDGPSNPTYAVVMPKAGGYLENYAAHPWMWIAPILGFAGPLLAIVSLRIKADPWAFIASSLGVFGTIATVGLSMFPIILPSTIDNRSSLMVWTASSSQMTLFIMLLVTAVLLPIVLIYTAWVYKVLLGRIQVAALKTNPDLY
jgi:cytochrome d ubiquinol oxidase subunit II